MIFLLLCQHEMIHAHAMATKTEDPKVGTGYSIWHGPNFTKKMNEINEKAHVNITVSRTRINWP